MKFNDQFLYQEQQHNMQQQQEQQNQQQLNINRDKIPKEYQFIRECNFLKF